MNKEPDMNYNELASGYARRRRASEYVLEELQRGSHVHSGSRILEVGCGTGNYLKALVEITNSQGWGIDPSREMMRYALGEDNMHFAEGIAEKIPFKDGFFDFVFSVNVIHFLENTLAYFQEAARVIVPGGFICTVTDSEENIRNRRPLSQYWPGTVEAELKRYPMIQLLTQQMTTIGSVNIEQHELHYQFEVTDITPYREKVYSCLRLISNTEFKEGLKRLEADMKSHSVQGVSEYVCLWGMYRKG